MSWLASLGSNILGTAVNTLAGHWSAKQNASLSKDIWRYQQQNAHQFEVQDLRAAGLNPILSATNSQIAGGGSVSAPSVSDNGAFSAMTQAASAKQLKLIDAEIESKKLDNDTKRLGLEAGRLDLDRAIGSSTIDLNNSAIDVNKMNSDYLKGKTENERAITASEVHLRKVQEEQIYNQMANDNAITSANVSKMRSSEQVDIATIHSLEASAKKSIEDSNLAYWQKQEIISDLTSETRFLEKLTARQRFDYLNNSFGSLSHQVGFGASLINPFNAISFGKGGSRLSSSGR